MPVQEIVFQMSPDHPLFVLDRVSDLLLPTIAARIVKDVPSTPIPLISSLRVLILTAFYGIDDYLDLIDQLRYNISFQWFAKCNLRQFDSKAHAVLVESLIRTQEASNLFEDFSTVIRQAPGPVSDLIVERLTTWKEEWCPKQVLFRNFRNSPVRRVKAFLGGIDVAPALFCDAGEFNDTFPDLLVSGEGDAAQYVFKTPDGQHYVTFEQNKTITLTSVARYESWEDSFEPYLRGLLNAFEKLGGRGVRALALSFFNDFVIPADKWAYSAGPYLNFLPDRLPQVAPPRFLAEQITPYRMPNLLTALQQSAEFAYPNSARRLIYSVNQPGIHIPRFSMEISITDPSQDEHHRIEKCAGRFDSMKSEIYAFFHSVTKDETLSLCA